MVNFQLYKPIIRNGHAHFLESCAQIEPVTEKEKIDSCVHAAAQTTGTKRE